MAVAEPLVHYWGGPGLTHWAYIDGWWNWERRELVRGSADGPAIGSTALASGRQVIHICRPVARARERDVTNRHAASRLS